MRSRDGNYSFSLSVCTLILFYSTLLSADEYLISYRYTVKDATLYSETLHVSKAMKKCSGIPQKELVLDTNEQDDLKKIISDNAERFIAYIHNLAMHVKHNETTINSKNTFTTILTLQTTCFKVDFNENFARIAPLK
ncbi:hypothetical protein KKG72_12005 [bacterium]|nr:hypothetical protein [bacterium]MBU1994839.1 hypothetical protein [bacterium]